jgi:hypothetical protein
MNDSRPASHPNKNIIRLSPEVFINQTFITTKESIINPGFLIAQEQQFNIYGKRTLERSTGSDS